MFEAGADSYDRFMGRYSRPLAPQLADLAGVEPGQRVLDVGCGSGVLTAELVARLGPKSVSAVDPSPSFVAAVRERHPGVDVHPGAAERLPFGAEEFDATLAQLVVHFMADPLQGLREMARVTRPGGVVAACVWDHGGGRAPVSPFWQAAHDVLTDVKDESLLAGARRGHLGELMTAAGLREIEETELSITVDHAGFEEWWQPFELGVGPAGAYLASLDPETQVRVRERCRELYPGGTFTLTSRAWAARGIS